jgi:hydrogenase maturation protein HypF
MIERGVRSPLTSSAGRLFDAASAMLGLCRRDAAEAEAAIALQRAAETDGSDAAYPFELRDGTLDFGPMIRAMVGDILSGAGAAKPARMFHNTLAAAVAAGCERARCERGIGRAALVGGVFQNRLLGGLVADALRAGGFSVYSPRLLPPTDAALSLGQAAVAWAGGGTGGAGE